MEKSDERDERVDDLLGRHFAALREDTLRGLHPPGAPAARRTIQQRRQRRVAALAVAAVLATLAGVAGVYAATTGAGRHAPAASPTRPPAATTASRSPSATPSATPTGTPDQGPTGAPAPAPPPPAQDTGSPTPVVDRCHTGDLAAAFIGGQGFAGGGTRNLVLTNISGTPCRLYGNPGMQLIDAAHQPLPTTVRWVGSRILFVLQPGQSGYASVTSWDVPATASPGPPCDPPAAGVIITPPDETTQLTVMGDWRVCNQGIIQVGALQPTPPEPT